MTKNNKLKNSEMFEKITTVGINLSVISSIVKFLDVSMNDSTNFSNADIHNLVVTLQKMLNLVMSDYYEIEQYIEA
ncbi:TPA: hypothetical protein IAA87_09910 [Candidatus Avigastranaerophilus faecigallinarum]|nr:hypothetical protein [Candidatus Avigastranaerophilus faecigallinarum]